MHTTRQCQACGTAANEADRICANCGAMLLNASAPHDMRGPEAALPPYGYANAEWTPPPPPMAPAVSPNPSIFKYYKIYCIFMAFLYLLVAGLGIFLLALPSVAGGEIRGKEAFEFQLYGGVYAVAGLIFAVPYAIAPFLPPKPWHWIYGIVLICLGFTSCLCLPVAVPLLIQWIKPENKVVFGKEL